MGIDQDVLHFIELLKALYFERRDIEALLECMDSRVSWIGAGAGEVSRGITETRAALEREYSVYSAAFRVEEGYPPSVLPLGEDACMAFGVFRAMPAEGSAEELHLRYSITCERSGDRFRLLHCHFSRADSFQEAVCAGNAVLRNQPEELDRQLQSLTQYIPGGAHQCKNDPNFTIMGVSDGFLSIFGYTREEIRARFDNKFLNMIYPGDRAEVLRSAHEQLKKGPTIELEYRVIRADGRTLWILDKGRLRGDGTEEECFYCILIDITQRKREQEELRLSLERHQVIMDQATDIIFEWDIQADKLSFSPNWRKKFGYAPISEEISSEIPLSQNIHSEDMPVFIKLMKDTAAGVPYSETEFRIKDSGGQYCWCRIRATTQFDADGRPIKAVGVIVDIDAEKKQKQALLDQAQRDALTGLYNKAAIHSLVEQHLHKSVAVGSQAMMIIDVDNFKAVNDTFGHLAGDSVLSDVASVLKGSVRATDLVGRIGGDEFLVYLPEVSDPASALFKAERLLTDLQIITPVPGAAHITCSIGVAAFPRSGVDYFTLCRHADQALYHRKHNGRGGVSLYSDELCGNESCGDGAPVARTVIGSDENRVKDEGLPQYVFRTLYAATNLESTLTRLLEIIGRAYDVSRAYLFESSPDGQRGRLTFEWCAAGVACRSASLQNLSYKEDLWDYQKNFNADGVFYCPDAGVVEPGLRDMLDSQGIRSMLQCAIWENGILMGGVGFDECRENRVWTPSQVASFRLTANVLATFLVKLRLKEQLQGLNGA